MMFSQNRSVIRSILFSLCPPTWGVMISLGAVHRGLPAAGGSSGVTSNPAESR